MGIHEQEPRFNQVWCRLETKDRCGPKTRAPGTLWCSTERTAQLLSKCLLLSVPVHFSSLPAANQDLDPLPWIPGGVRSGPNSSRENAGLSQDSFKFLVSSLTSLYPIKLSCLNI